MNVLTPQRYNLKKTTQKAESDPVAKSLNCSVHQRTYNWIPLEIPKSSPSLLPLRVELEHKKDGLSLRTASTGKGTVFTLRKKNLFVRYKYPLGNYGWKFPPVQATTVTPQKTWNTAGGASERFTLQPFFFYISWGGFLLLSFQNLCVWEFSPKHQRRRSGRSSWTSPKGHQMLLLRKKKKTTEQLHRWTWQRRMNVWTISHDWQ